MITKRAGDGVTGDPQRTESATRGRDKDRFARPFAVPLLALHEGRDPGGVEGQGKFGVAEAG